MIFVKSFQDISLQDIALVGGKNASLGHMIQFLKSPRVHIPLGFAITVNAYTAFLQDNNISDSIANLLKDLTLQDEAALKIVANKIRSIINQGTIPPVVQREIIDSYAQLCAHYNEENISVAVRSSATAEDLPGASFAGQQDTFLHIQGKEDLLNAYKDCIASLFTDRALMYRIIKGFDHMQVGISVGVQKMVRSDLACSGVAFSIDPENGNKKVYVIEAVFGLGELLVQGNVIPDEYRLYAPHVNQSFSPIIDKKYGDRNKKLIYNFQSLQETAVNTTEQFSFCLTDDEICSLGLIIKEIHTCYSEFYGIDMPMDIEWAKDGIDEALYVVQARPETVHAQAKTPSALERYFLKEAATPILTGQSIGQKIATGPVQNIISLDHETSFQPGSVLVTRMTNPDWLPLMKKASAIVTDIGGRTCHAAIVSRELGIPALVGTYTATSTLSSADIVTVDCSQGAVGYVYEGAKHYEKKEISQDNLVFPPIDLMVNLADPSQAPIIAQIPGVAGVGLARVEFIIANNIKIHPMACAKAELLEDLQLKERIAQQARGYASPAEFFIQSLVYGIGTLASAFYPRPVVVRFSDFKTNEYAHLLGGNYFEFQEQNPMLGLRGASRYYSTNYQAAFALECEAIRRIHTTLGFTNVIPMIPFVRTPQEAQKVLKVMKLYGIDRHKGFKVFMMVEIPSNVILFDEYAPLFDGFSIGSNDLTQFTLAVDRDSSELNNRFDERDPAVQALIGMTIQAARKNGVYIGMCGQAPSDYPELASSLIDKGINSLSLNTDSIMSFLSNYKNKPKNSF